MASSLDHDKAYRAKHRTTKTLFLALFERLQALPSQSGNQEQGHHPMQLTMIEKRPLRFKVPSCEMIRMLQLFCSH